MRAHSQGCGRSVDRGTRGPGIEPRNTCPVAKAAGGPGCRGCGDKPKATPGLPLWQGSTGPRAVTDPVHARKHFAREPGGPRVFCNIECRARREAFGRTPISHGAGKSDCWVVPKKPPNKAGSEMAWRRAKGNPSDGNAYRTPSRVHATSVRGPIRLAAFCWPDRHDPRQEPYAVVPHVRICGGGAG